MHSWWNKIKSSGEVETLENLFISQTQKISWIRQNYFISTQSNFLPVFTPYLWNFNFKADIKVFSISPRFVEARISSTMKSCWKRPIQFPVLSSVLLSLSDSIFLLYRVGLLQIGKFIFPQITRIFRIEKSLYFSFNLYALLFRMKSGKLLKGKLLVLRFFGIRHGSHKLWFQFVTFNRSNK